MKMLSIETASEVCSVAILEDSKVIKEINLENGNTHSQNLMPLISKILEETKLKLNDIDLFACDNGPGSFTGIRIGIATLKAFRDVTLKSIIGVSSLEALAYNVKEANTDFICSIIDAKNDNVYYGIFAYNNQNLIKIEDYKFDNINSLLKYFQTEKFSNKNIFFVGNAGIVYKNVIQFQLNERALFTNEILLNKLNAVSIAKVAINKFNEDLDFSNVIPLYLKKSSAEIKMEELNEFVN